MRPRTASKIVARVQAGKVTHSSYSRVEVEAAFKARNVPLTPEHLKPWMDRAAKVKHITEQQPIAQASIEARRQARAARIAARVQAAKERPERIQNLEAARQAQEAVAVEAAREAFKQALENEVTELPESTTLETGSPELDQSLLKAGEISPTPEAAQMAAASGQDEVFVDFESKNVADLKALAKERGLSGYSSLKKDDLIALLKGE